MLIEDLRDIVSFFNHMEETFPWDGARSSNSAHNLRSAGDRKNNSSFSLPFVCFVLKCHVCFREHREDQILPSPQEIDCSTVFLLTRFVLSVLRHKSNNKSLYLYFKSMIM